MTATVFAFPTPFERDQDDFERSGVSALTRAIEEAANLWEAVKVVKDRPALADRIAALRIAIERMGTYRPDELDDLVLTADGAEIASLAMMPHLLAVIAKRCPLPVPC